MKWERLKVSKWLVPVIRKLRERSFSRRELEKELGIHRASLSRIIQVLREAELIHEEDDKIYWHEYFRTYESREQYEADLNHSKILFEEGVKSPFFELPRLDDSEIYVSERVGSALHRQHFIEHLKSAYPELFALYEEARDIREGIVTNRKKFLEIAKRASKLPSVVYPKNVALAIYLAIESRLRGFPPEKPRLEGGWVVCGRSKLAKEEGAKDVLKFIERERDANQNIKICEKLVKLEEKLIELESKFGAQLTHLRLLVESGTPLKGRCEICPQISFKIPEKI